MKDETILLVTVIAGLVLWFYLQNKKEPEVQQPSNGFQAAANPVIINPALL